MDFFIIANLNKSATFLPSYFFPFLADELSRTLFYYDADLSATVYIIFSIDTVF
jgi:hypothetical protein